jgi:hypothetical protein
MPVIFFVAAAFLTAITEERWQGANGLRATGNFVLAFHYRRPSEKTEGGQSIPIADGWKGTESDDNHNVRSWTLLLDRI